MSKLDPILNRPTCPLCGVDWTYSPLSEDYSKANHILIAHGGKRRNGAYPYSCACGQSCGGPYTLLNHLRFIDDPLYHLIESHTINQLAANA